MTDSQVPDVDRFRLLANYIAGRSLTIAEAPVGKPAHTNGAVIFVSAGQPDAEQRREVLIQSALLGAGSLDQRLVKPLRARPAVARRYLALEGHRALAELAERLPLAAAIRPDGQPRTATADQSLEAASGRAHVADPPKWFGVITPWTLRTPPSGPGSTPTDDDLRFDVDPVDQDDDDDDDDGDRSDESKILKLFETPLPSSRALAEFLRKLLGSSRSPGNRAAGAELQVGSVRRAPAVGTNARPLPTRITFSDADTPGAALGVGGSRHPEWDVFGKRYRPEWCRVVDFPLTSTVEVSAADVMRDEVLRRRLARIGLGRWTVRARPDGDELDVEALLELSVDQRCGYSPPEHVYLKSRKLARDLGVLIMLDASGSATDANPDGLAVHDQQCIAAATLTATLEELGDRVALYAFRSHGRHAVALPTIKTFDQRFGALARARLNQLEPAGYTRLGAGIRGAADILKRKSGTPNRLLIVLTDGFPYDDGYEGRYAEADTHKALDELRADGVACLCLTIGSAQADRALERVFGSASHASAATLAELSPRMDELFLFALRELAAPKQR